MPSSEFATSASSGQKLVCARTLITVLQTMIGLLERYSELVAIAIVEKNIVHPCELSRQVPKTKIR